MEVTAFTDGSSLGNPGSGASAYVIVAEDAAIREYAAGFHESVTNNFAEAFSVLKVCQALLECSTPGSCIEIVTDSMYVINGVRNREKWERNRNLPNRPVWTALWRMLTVLEMRNTVRFEWCRGHAGNKWNERCDLLARTRAADRRIPMASFEEVFNKIAWKSRSALKVRIEDEVYCVCRNGEYRRPAVKTDRDLKQDSPVKYADGLDVLYLSTLSACKPEVFLCERSLEIPRDMHLLWYEQPDTCHAVFDKSGKPACFRLLSGTMQDGLVEIDRIDVDKADRTFMSTGMYFFRFPAEVKPVLRDPEVSLALLIHRFRNKIVLRISGGKNEILYLSPDEYKEPAINNVTTMEGKVEMFCDWDAESGFYTRVEILKKGEKMRPLPGLNAVKPALKENEKQPVRKQPVKEIQAEEVPEEKETPEPPDEEETLPELPDVNDPGFEDVEAMESVPEEKEAPEPPDEEVQETGFSSEPEEEKDHEGAAEEHVEAEAAQAVKRTRTPRKPSMQIPYAEWTEDLASAVPQDISVEAAIEEVRAIRDLMLNAVRREANVAITALMKNKSRSDDLLGKIKELLK